MYSGAHQINNSVHERVMGNCKYGAKQNPVLLGTKLRIFQYHDITLYFNKIKQLKFFQLKLYREHEDCPKLR